MHNWFIIEHMLYEGEADRLYPAPLNELGCPPGPSKDKLYEGRRLVLVRLVWRTHTEIRPGVALHSDQGRVQVEWSPGGEQTRHTWLAEEDVRPRLKYGG